MLVAILVLSIGCNPNPTDPQGPSSGSAPGKAVPDRAQGAQPLEAGAQAPTATLRDPRGQPVELGRLYGQKPTTLIFYRGGWCPYCNDHLGQIASVEPEVVRLGYQVLAISPDRPEELAKTQDKQGLQYRLLSDSDVELARSFGLVFRVDYPTITRYRGYGIDLEEASGRDHHMLPVPAVYIVDTDGEIRFAHWDADYKKRLDAQVLLERARAIAEESDASVPGD